jgi:hypothetical protein
MGTDAGWIVATLLRTSCLLSFASVSSRLAGDDGFAATLLRTVCFLLASAMSALGHLPIYESVSFSDNSRYRTVILSIADDVIE